MFGLDDVIGMVLCPAYIDFDRTDLIPGNLRPRLRVIHCRGKHRVRVILYFGEYRLTSTLAAWLRLLEINTVP